MTVPERILVTGGCGFVGSAVVRHFVRHRRVQVLNIDKLTYAGDPETVAEIAADPLYQFVRIDICDAAALRAAFADFAHDAVLHLAAESHVDRSLDSPDNFVATNVIGTFVLLETALRYWQGASDAVRARFRLLHASTDEVYGSLALGDPARFDERSRYAPNSPHAATKAGADHLARAWWRSYGLPVIVTTASNNYGPYQFPDKLIPRMIIAALDGAALPVYGTGANVRDWLHVDDHVRALELALARGQPGETYALGGGEERPNIELVRRICAALDELVVHSPHRPHERLIAFVADRPGHDLRYAIDSTRACRELGWRPRESLDSGLRATVGWYVENRAWWQRLRSRYLGDRLGLDIRR